MAVDREALARALREARENSGMSQEAAAKRLGLSRTVLAQIELGNRTVSSDELSKLATVYDRAVADFGSDVGQDGDLSALISKYGKAIPSEFKPALDRVLSLCAEAVAVEQLLGRPSRTGPPHYDLPRPRNTADAILQGERVAAQERLRLGLGPEAAVDDVSELLGSQGARVAVLQFPEEEIAGIYLRHPSIGLLIVAGRNDIGSQRFGLLHGYALELFDWERAFVVTTPVSSEELIQIRATAFAAAFLLPQAGVEAAIAGLDKGRPSRRALAVFGYATEEFLESEIRSVPGSQILSCHDVATVARRFGSSYEATIYRLRALDVISKAETKELLRPEQRRAASTYAKLFTATSERGPRPATDEALALKRHLTDLAIEAYRRRLTSKADLAALASKLQLAGLTSAKLLELAEAAR
jgi:transcriptional regulator with XRE-family HTH domain